MISFLDLIFKWVNILWIVTGTKKEAPLRCDTSVYSRDRSIYQLPLQWAYRTLQPRIHPVLTFCSGVNMFIEYLMVLFVCGCKCREFFLISNTSRQLFSRAKSLISKDIKFFLEASFSGVKYRYNDSFIIIIFTETLTREFVGKSQIFELKSQIWYWNTSMSTNIK